MEVLVLSMSYVVVNCLLSHDVFNVFDDKGTLGEWESGHFSSW